jgi:hypothetical protein
MSEKDRDEIAGMLTDKEIENLGAPWLSMAQAQPQAYLPPLPQPYVGPPKDRDNGDDNKSLSIEGYGEASGGPRDKIKQLSPYGAMRLRYGRSF